MTLISKYKRALMATALLALPASALAQNEAVTDQANDVADQANELAESSNDLNAAVADEITAEDAARNDALDGDRDDDGDEGKWGLLGLLGLAGLLGLKRRDTDDAAYRRTDAGARTGTDRDRM